MLDTDAKPFFTPAETDRLGWERLLRAEYLARKKAVRSLKFHCLLLGLGQFCTALLVFLLKLPERFGTTRL